MKRIDLKTLLIGLLLGVCVTLTMAQRAAEPAHKLDADYRYQISAVREDNGAYNLLILDHETNKVFKRQWWDNSGKGFDLKKGLVEGN